MTENANTAEEIRPELYIIDRIVDVNYEAKKIEEQGSKVQKLKGAIEELEKAVNNFSEKFAKANEKVEVHKICKKLLAVVEKAAEVSKDDVSEEMEKLIANLTQRCLSFINAFLENQIKQGYSDDPLVQSSYTLICHQVEKAKKKLEYKHPILESEGLKSLITNLEQLYKKLMTGIDEREKACLISGIITDEEREKILTERAVDAENQPRLDFKEIMKI